MSASGEAWVRHRTECDKCAAWWGAEPGARLCGTGAKMEERMRRDAGAA